MILCGRTVAVYIDVHWLYLSMSRPGIGMVGWIERAWIELESVITTKSHIPWEKQNSRGGDR